MHFFIVTPTYRRLELLKRNIDSVQSQSFRGFTHYIIDDSGDNVTSLWIEENNQTQTVYLKNAVNMGSNASKNRALDDIMKYQNQEGYIIFLDDDDFLAPGALEELSNMVKRTKKSWYITLRCFANNTPITRNQSGEGEYKYVRDYLLGNHIQGDATHTISMSVLGDVRFPTGIKNGEEWMFFLQLARNSEIYFSPLSTTLSDGYLEDGLTTASSDIAFRQKMFAQMYKQVGLYFPEVNRWKIIMGFIYYARGVWHLVHGIKRIINICQKYARWIMVVFSITMRKFIDNPVSLFSFLKKHVYYRFIADSEILCYRDFHFLSYTETLDYAIKNNCTLIRFGDEIFDMLQGLGLYFNDWHQQYNKNLVDGLKKVLANQDDKILLCFNPELILLSKDEFRNQGIGEQWQFWINSKIFLKKYLQKSRIYGRALLFHTRYNPELDFEKLGEFFGTKHIIIIVNRSNRFVECSLGKTTHFIEAPQNNAWDNYNTMKVQVLQIVETQGYKSGDVLVLGSASSATKVLAWDLQKNHGITSWDTGQFFDLAAKKIQELGKSKR